jgi:hypothetical protein
MSSLRAIGLMTACVLLVGCSSTAQGPPRKPVSPVTGELIVDGKPAAMVQVELHDPNAATASVHSYSMAYTEADGKFSFTTYEQNDGVPPGEYTVLFYWGDMNLVTKQYGGPDKLKNKYREPGKSPVKLKVEEGKPTDLGRIELTTK